MESEEHQPVDVLRRWVDAVNARDLDALLAVADQDIICRPMSVRGGGATFTGHAGLRRWIARLAAVASDLHVRCDRIDALGPTRAAAFGVLYADERVVSPWALVASVRDGKVCAAQSYFTDRDTLAAIDGLGDGETVV